MARSPTASLFFFVGQMQMKHFDHAHVTLQRRHKCANVCVTVMLTVSEGSQRPGCGGEHICSCVHRNLAAILKRFLNKDLTLSEGWSDCTVKLP